MSKDTGLYESIVTAQLKESLNETAELRTLGSSEGARRLAGHFGGHLETVLTSLPADGRPTSQVALVNDLLEVVERHNKRFRREEDQVTPQLLLGVHEQGPPPRRPQLPLSESGLYVNANREKTLDVALVLEGESADRIDLICAFLFWTGYIRVRGMIKAHLERGRSLRVLTTTYCGATQSRVLDDLIELGAEVRVSYNSSSTRLHAKAWLFHRNSGFGTAFVGSSNLSSAALTSGLEWNVRLSQIENRAVFGELSAAFENHWNDEEFLPYDHDTFVETMLAERPKGVLRAVFSLRPRTFQRAILERLDAERTLHGRHRNLVVAATGTGKTVIAALDYARLCGAAGERLRLLFVAHRKEILDQSRDTFRHAVSDGAFGELYVAGAKPHFWTHVFASVQSLSNAELDVMDKAHFHVIVIDEFHHAAAPTYRRIIEHFEPMELLGLTATPERADGQSVLEWFDGRLASELRIWDAIERGLLVPFQYFASHDMTDLCQVWRRGRYDLKALGELYTGHHARAHLVIESIRQQVHDATRMRALAFCVGVDHARFMAGVFESAGIATAVVVGETSKADRQQAIRALRDGTLACIVTVDVFNEGVDIPEVDTLLLLRPTESATLFLQQLGRGLRHAEGKRCLTVLDFVGVAHDRFQYAQRFRALLGQMDRWELEKQVQDDFPFLPSGCSIQLDRVSKEIILNNIAARLSLNKRSLAKELSDSGARSLAAFLKSADVSLMELYRGGRTFTELKRITGLETSTPGPDEARICRGVGRLIHVDDSVRIQAWLEWLKGQAGLSEPLRMMLITTLFDRTAAADLLEFERRLREHPALLAELVELLSYLSARLTHTTTAWAHPSKLVLQVHANYRLNEIMAAFCDVRSGGLYLPREGVHFDRKSRCNLLFVTLQKDEDDYSATTMYADYAIGPNRFHWQSQSGTRPTDKKGRRHVAHLDDGITPLLFVRERRKDTRGVTMAYEFLGPCHLHSTNGQRPMNVEWELEYAMPARTLQLAKVIG